MRGCDHANKKKILRVRQVGLLPCKSRAECRYSTLLSWNYAFAGAVGVETTEAQKAQRRAAMGISLRHSGHFLLVGSDGIALRAARAFQAFIGAIIKK